MNFRIKKRESVRQAFGRIGHGLIGEIRRDLQHPGASEIHQARKSLKSLRSLLRLVRRTIDPEEFARTMEAIRNLARSLGTARDAAVRLAVFRELAQGDEFSELDAALAVEATSEQAHPFSQVARRHASATIRSIEIAWSSLYVDTPGWPAIGPGLRRTYRRARNAFRKLPTKPTDSEVHEWRKRTKDLLYQLRLLRGLNPSQVEKRCTKLEKLDDLVGRDHDLALLEAFLTASPNVTTQAREELHKRSRKQRRQGLARARRIAHSLFSSKPRTFIEEVERWWWQWRE